MAKKKEDTSAVGLSSGLFDNLAKLTGDTGKVNPDDLDARLLWMVVGILATRCASIQIGVTRDGGAWAVQYWDGKFPLKYYFRDTDEFNRQLAALIRADKGRDVSPEWAKILEGYGW